jgi:hypothetical protein
MCDFESHEAIDTDTVMRRSAGRYHLYAMHLPLGAKFPNPCQLEVPVDCQVQSAGIGIGAQRSVAPAIPGYPQALSGTG